MTRKEFGALSFVYLQCSCCMQSLFSGHFTCQSVGLQLIFTFRRADVERDIDLIREI